MPIRPENRGRYPADWAAISHWIRFVRAEGRCECVGECGRGTHEGRCPNRHREPAYGSGSTVVLTTAHLDHQPENCDPANLRAMCQGCHLFYDRDHHAETRAATRAAVLASWMDPLPLDLGRKPPVTAHSVSIAGLRITVGADPKPPSPHPAIPPGGDQMSQRSGDPRITQALLDFLRQNTNGLLQEDTAPALWVAITSAPGDVLAITIENTDGQVVARYQATLTMLTTATPAVAGDSR